MHIDGIFSGGGIKGFALIGAYEAIESRGLRFVRLAGTSAGAIMAALIAAGYTSTELKSIIKGVDGKELLDDTLFDLPFVRWLKVYFSLGLYKGKKLEQWIDGLLMKKGIRSFGDLAPGALRVVTSDITNGRILTLPDDLPAYRINPQTFSIARAVRMSCTLPYFFQPVKLPGPHGKALILDGGMLSNFPLWLFDEEKKKKRPALGIKLSTKTMRMPRQIHNGADLFSAMFHTMKDAHDARYISKRHANNIVFIPVEGTSATDFGLSDEKKDALIQIGRGYTEAFLKRWCY
ncbi:patatin-like phospholipase family protein [Bacillus badius]|uniref:patatin-like phospholipase family protein n=1 Tax=Bacillus badius TaxID=1455 RepID=UPI0005974C82|nr:patatin-like phospholipase family protein [Bacillus badius]KIL75274.1 lysophospholipase-like family protein [Bacillus badius]